MKFLTLSAGALRKERASLANEVASYDASSFATDNAAVRGLPSGNDPVGSARAQRAFDRLCDSAADLGCVVLDGKLFAIQLKPFSEIRSR